MKPAEKEEATSSTASALKATYMENDGFYQCLEQVGIAPVVVIDHTADAVPLAQALIEGGLPIAEVTFRTDVAAKSIELIAHEYPDMLVGAGTILNLEQCKQAVEAGARFIVSPGTDLETVDWCIANHIDIVPAAVTPTEIMTLIARGISVTKFFPANLYGGNEAISALASVFRGHRFMPTGGISPENLLEYIDNPAVLAVGGTWMVKRCLFSDGSFRRVADQAASARHAVEGARAGAGSPAVS